MPRRRKSYFLGLFFILIMTANAQGHDGGLMSSTWTTLSTFGLFDSRNEKFLTSYDINVSWFILNGGLSYNYTNTAFTGYAGIGMLSLIQLQAGFSPDGFSLRNRYEIPIPFTFLGMDKEMSGIPKILSYMSISISIEKHFYNSDKNWYFGLGISLSIVNNWSAW